MSEMEGLLAVAGIAERSTAADDYVRAARARVNDAYRLAGYLLGNEAEAQDAVQDALIKAWRNWSSLRDAASFNAWFDRIVVNVCRDRMRRHRKIRMVELEQASEVEGTDVFVAMFRDDEVAAAVSRLGPDHRAIVVLRFWRDLQLEDVASTLGIPVGTVKSRLHYALRQLRAELGEPELEA
jgi:RNA polymerase sigma-70 factor (ECF subfamily)